ncbi:hypothetical protein LJC62_05060, partial [Odoribacter sp. OttesenSCG-928-A06]|nr:hypothetical protein [Odoribacter sp. OttesenSCG-928-A06]
TISNNQYGLSGIGNYVKKAKVEENGYYEVTLPAREDGAPVLVNIEGNPVVVKVDMDGLEEERIFTIENGTQVSIMKGLSYQKKITYEYDESLQEMASWTEGTFKVRMVYHNGKEEVAVPEGTEIKVIIDGDQFIPERENELVMIEKVGADGVLEIKMQAPSLLYGGIGFEIESRFIADRITVNAGVNTTLKGVYACGEMNTVYGAVIGGEVFDAGKIVFDFLDYIEAEDLLATWKNATYKVNMLYDNDLMTDTNFVAVPNDARVTITEYRYAQNSDLSDVRKTMTYGEFINGGAGYTTLAPDPSLSNGELEIYIAVDFLADIQTSGTPEEPVMNKFKFSIGYYIYLRGTITTLGGSDLTQKDGTIVKNAMNVDGFATQLTFN